MLGLSFACDQPYEEVAGIKIGCPLGSSTDYRKYTAAKDMFGGGAVFRNIDNLNPFNVEVILSIDGVVEGLMLMTPENAVSKEDFYALVSSMKDRWGKPEIAEAQYSMAASFPKIESGVLSSVGALFKEMSGEIMVIYRSQKSLDAEERQEAIDKAKLKRKFEGF